MQINFDWRTISICCSQYLRDLLKQQRKYHSQKMNYLLIHLDLELNQYTYLRTSKQLCTIKFFLKKKQSLKLNRSLTQTSFVCVSSHTLQVSGLLTILWFWCVTKILSTNHQPNTQSVFQSLERLLSTLSSEKPWTRLRNVKMGKLGNAKHHSTKTFSKPRKRQHFCGRGLVCLSLDLNNRGNKRTVRLLQGIKENLQFSHKISSTCASSSAILCNDACSMHTRRLCSSSSKHVILYLNSAISCVRSSASSFAFCFSCFNSSCTYQKQVN